MRSQSSFQFITIPAPTRKPLLPADIKMFQPTFATYEAVTTMTVGSAFGEFVESISVLVEMEIVGYNGRPITPVYREYAIINPNAKIGKGI